MTIILDAMGSDAHPDPEVQAAVTVAREDNTPIILVGNQDIIQPKLDALNANGLPIRVVHTQEVLEMDDKPVENARKKAENSMAVGLDLIKSGDGEAFITAGNTGGAMANALMRLKRIKGVLRPALTAVFPVQDGRAVVLDIGANADCRPEFLHQFAMMGSIYAELVLGIKKPRVALLSNGEEAGKGNQLVKETYPLLAASDLNFIGNAESKELFGGKVDVIVTDGFSGNILLKTSEAVAKMITTQLKKELMSSPRTKIGGLLAKPAFENLRKLMDPSEYGAAPLLGVDGLVFVGHGKSDARAIVSAIRVARRAVEANLLGALRVSIEEKMAETSHPVDA
ncbi:MAG TPA: phosphate acyltransferase PlsX [Anaerolineaceae bacterium]|nr:phosphate acyltransferase PlsX [Anaerolineaceae bacterium]